MATILFDDNSGALVFGQDAVYETQASHNFIGGSAVAIFSGSLDFVFSGIEIGIFGRMNRNDSSSRGVPVPNIGEVLMDGTPIESNVTVPDDDAIGLIYQLPQLSDTKHILTLSNVSSIILDFIEVTAGNTASLSGSTLLLSSSDTAISYEGNWNYNATILVDDVHQYRRPIGGATRDANFGDGSATISFAGTSISVSGTHYSDPRGPCHPTFYLDGKKQSYQSPRRSGPNYPWFSSQRISNGNHVLKIDLSGNTPGAHFSLEYITYTASNLDTNSHQIPASVFVGVGVGVGVVVIGILLVIMWWWRRRRSRRQQSDTAATSTDTSGLPHPAHQDLDTGRMNQTVQKSSDLQAHSTRILTPHDLPAVKPSTRQNEPSTSLETRHIPTVDSRSTQVQRLSHYEEQQIIKPLVPRRREEARTHSQPEIPNRSTTETSSQRLPQFSVYLPHDIVPSGLANHRHHLNRELNTDHYQDVVTATSEGMGKTHLPEGAWGMRVQQLEELMRELREGTAPSELGHDQVGTGHSTTLSGLMEEFSEYRRNQTRGGEGTLVPHRNAS